MQGISSGDVFRVMQVLNVYLLQVLGRLTQLSLCGTELLRHKIGKDQLVSGLFHAGVYFT